MPLSLDPRRISSYPTRNHPTQKQPSSLPIYQSDVRAVLLLFLPPPSADPIHATVQNQPLRSENCFNRNVCQIRPICNQLPSFKGDLGFGIGSPNEYGRDCAVPRKFVRVRELAFRNSACYRKFGANLSEGLLTIFSKDTY